MLMSYVIRHLIDHTLSVAVTRKELECISREDEEFGKVKLALTNNNWDKDIKNYKFFQPQLGFYNNILLRGSRIIISTKLRPRILIAAHENQPGVVAMKARLRKTVWWPNMDEEAENHIKKCTGCIFVAGPTPPNPLRRRQFPAAPWVDTAMDFMGSLPSGDYLFVIIDYFSQGSRSSENYSCH